MKAEILTVCLHPHHSLSCSRGALLPRWSRTPCCMLDSRDHRRFCQPLFYLIIMDKAKQDKINQIKEDYETDWWRAKESDDFDLKSKLLRVGCRPLKRKYLACSKGPEQFDPENYQACRVCQYFLIIYRSSAGSWTNATGLYTSSTCTWIKKR